MFRRNLSFVELTACVTCLIFAFSTSLEAKNIGLKKLSSNSTPPDTTIDFGESNWDPSASTANVPVKSIGESIQKSDAKRIARKVLNQRTGRYSLRGDHKQELTVQNVQQSPAGYHVRFKQTRRGLPVFNGGFVVNMDKQGNTNIVH
ncbi:MAG: hypothetical protein ABEJ65_06475, partial [bacterium]